MSVETFTFTGHLDSPVDLTPGRGFVEITPSQTISDGDSNVVVAGVKSRVTLDGTGDFSVGLPTGIGYHVRPVLYDGYPPEVDFTVPTGTVTLDMADVTNAAISPLDPTGIQQAEAYTDLSLARRGSGFFARVPGLAMFDDFQRPDQTIATLANEGTQAPSGHQYTADSPITPGIISGGRFRWTDETSFGGTPIRILATQMARLPETIAARFVLTPGDTAGANVVMGACQVSFSQGSIQLSIWRDRWKMFVVPNPIVDPYPEIASGVFDPELSADGVTEYEASARYDPATSSLFVALPDGGYALGTDMRIGQYWGNRVCWQLRREAVTDGAARWLAIGVGTAQPVASGIPAALALPYTHGTYVTTSPPPTWVPSDLQLVVDALPTGGWVSGSIQGLISQWGGSGHQSWALTVAANGKPNLYISLTGSDSNLLVSSAAIPTSANRIKATYNHTTGDAIFYYSLDHGGAYTQLGTTQNLSGGGVPHAVPAQVPIQVGARNNASTLMFGGTMSLAELYDGIGGTLLAQADFSAAWTGRGYTDSLLNKWLIVGTGWSWAITEAAVNGLVADLATLTAGVAANTAGIAALGSRLISELTSTVNWPNSTSEHTLWTPTAMLAANLVAGVTKLTLKLGGKIDCKAASGVYIVKVKANGTSVATFTVAASQTGAGTGRAWDCAVDIYVDAVGVNGLISAVGRGVQINAGGTTWIPLSTVSEGVAADVSTSLAMTVTASMVTADVANIIYFCRGILLQDA